MSRTLSHLGEHPGPRVIPVDRRGSGIRKLEGDAMIVTFARFPAFTSERHTHARPMCTVTLDGVLRQQVCGASYDGTPGVLLTKDAGEAHVDRFSRGGAEVLLFELSASAPHLDTCVSRLLAARCVADVDARPLARRIARELVTPDDVSPLMVESLALELLGTAARHHGSVAARSAPVWLERARELLLASMNRPPTIAQVARIVDVHPVRLARAFRVFLGASPGALVRRARLDRAAAEVAGTDRPLAEIAQWAGFGDQSHFTRAFKRHTGVTPGEYRRATRPRANPR
ncbi:MAG TPA: AraC family transcriptional regulator [Gemmatimonadaceae bacterium]|nr:AraC family transcriptional regulator [Gemmatimonadaceae bacterium]